VAISTFNIILFIYFILFIHVFNIVHLKFPTPSRKLSGDFRSYAQGESRLCFFIFYFFYFRSYAQGESRLCDAGLI
jgi:hypothetical protein